MSPSVGENSEALCALAPLREGFVRAEASAIGNFAALTPLLLCLALGFLSAITLLPSALLNAGSADVPSALSGAEKQNGG